MPCHGIFSTYSFLFTWANSPIHCSLFIAPASIIASIGIQFEYIEDKSITPIGISMYMQTNIVHVGVFVETQTRSKLLHEPRA
jgi:hypothetical protein